MSEQYILPNVTNRIFPVMQMKTAKFYLFGLCGGRTPCCERSSKIYSLSGRGVETSIVAPVMGDPDSSLAAYLSLLTIHIGRVPNPHLSK